MEKVVLIDREEFQSEVLSFVYSDEFDTSFNATVFSGNDLCKQAMRQGALLASAVSSKCKSVVIKAEQMTNFDKLTMSADTLHEFMQLIHNIDIPDKAKYFSKEWLNQGYDSKDGIWGILNK